MLEESLTNTVVQWLVNGWIKCNCPFPGNSLIVAFGGCLYSSRLTCAVTPVKLFRLREFSSDTSHRR